MHGQGTLSIWFFIGVLLPAYGVLILGAGLYELQHRRRNIPWCWPICTRASGGARAADRGIGVFHPLFSEKKVMSQIATKSRHDVRTDRRQSRFFSGSSGAQRGREE